MTIIAAVSVPSPTPSTSGAWLFNPQLSEVLDEAYERLGEDPQWLTLRHIVSARRSMNLMLKEWFNRGVKQWAIDLQTVSTTVGMTSFTTPDGTIDLFDMVMRRDGVDTEMYPIGRHDYMILHSKTQQGRADRYFVDRKIANPIVNIWQAGENTTDQLLYYRFVQLEDAGGAANTLNIPDRFQEAFVSGLAAKLARKWKPELVGELRGEAEFSLEQALTEDRDRAPLSINPSYRR